MFELSFGKIVLFLIVALIVLGPERLPKVARTLGQWMGRIQGFVSNVKNELNSEINATELGKIKDDIQSAASAMRLEMQNSISSMEDELSAMQKQVGHDKGRDAWMNLPPMRTVDDFAEERDWIQAQQRIGNHRLSLGQQARQSRRSYRPKPLSSPKLRIRRRLKK